MRSIRWGALSVCLLSIPSVAHAQTVVYYSVGTDASDLKSGSPNVTISSGTATFTTAQPDNVGVGDQVTYDGGTIAYVSGRTASTVYTLITATGGTPPNIAGASVDSIARAFNAVSMAVTGSADGTHLNTFDLVAGDYQLNLACYDDAPMSDGETQINGFTTGPSNYIRIFTPTHSSEVGVSQRHRGVAGTGFRLSRSADISSDGTYIQISIEDEYVRIEGVEIDGSGLVNGNDIRGIQVWQSGGFGAGSDVRISDNIVHSITNTDLLNGTRRDVEGITAGDGTVRISNNIIYGLDNKNSNTESRTFGIILWEADVTGYVYNNTLYDLKNTGSTHQSVGISQFDATVTAKNNFVGDVDSTSGLEFCFASGGVGSLTQSNNVSSDATATGPINQTAYATYFVDVTAGSENLHLLDDSNSLWGSFGADVDGDANLPVTKDIDGQARDATTPDIGADEFNGVHAPLSVARTASTITVTAVDQFELEFDEASGGGIEEFYDLAIDPGRATDLSAGIGSVRTLHNMSLKSGGVFYGSSSDDTESHAYLLEATKTRVKVRERAVLEEDATGNILPGVKVFRDNAIYGSGRVGTSLRLVTTDVVSYDEHPIELTMHYSGTGGDPLNAWSMFAESGSTFPTATGGDDFILHQIDAPTVKTDFVRILHEDWTTPTFVEDADQSDAGPFAAEQWQFITWRHLGATSFPADTEQIWNSLTYFKPTDFVDNVDPAVTTRRDDYRSPSTVALMVGQRWLDASENTGGGDDFNEAEAAYALTFDPAGGLRFDIDGGTTRRYSPFFKVRQWRSMADPAVTLEGATLVNDVDFQADVKPVSRAHFAQDLAWHSTLENLAALDTTPDVGTAVSPAVFGTINFVPGRYGGGAQVVGTTSDFRFPVAGNLDTAKGALEFWFKPDYASKDGSAHTIAGYNFNGANFWLIEKDNANNLRFRINALAVTSEIVAAPATYDWRAKDWVHLRFEWDDTLPVATQLKIFVDGVEPNPGGGTGADYVASTNTSTNFQIGRRSPGGGSPGIYDEIRLYSGSGSTPSLLARGGLRADAAEYLADTGKNFVLNFQTVDANRRGEYLYFGADSKFRGLNVALATNGVGAVDLQWQYWNGAAWTDLESGFGFTDETNHLSRDGTIYWTGDPASWSLYSVNGEPDLFYVRAHLTSGTYSTSPVEAIIKTDILLLQYCGDVTASAQTFELAVPSPTAVELVDFHAQALDGGVELSWETASELDNLGFHLYRSRSSRGPFRRITTRPIPGLGSSPHGARYSYRDTGLDNGMTYFYELEDLETTGGTKRHGPVSAIPLPGANPPPEPRGEIDVDSGATGARITFGRPEQNALRVVRRSDHEVIVELRTEGFYAEALDDGTVRLSVPELASPDEEEGLSVPVRRLWVDAIAGRKVRLVSVRALKPEWVEGLTPSATSAELMAMTNGAVRLRLKRGARPGSQPNGADMHPAQWARLVDVGFQQDSKKALVELSPLRWEPTSGRLLLSKRLRVRVAFRGREPSESSFGGNRGRRRRSGRTYADSAVVARLVTHDRGLYAVRYEELFGRRSRPVSVKLSRKGEPVRYHLEPAAARFAPGSTLYFFSEGQTLNAYGNEAVYELSFGDGESMPVRSAESSAPSQAVYQHRVLKEENRLYQPAFLDAPDRWLWDFLLAPTAKSYAFRTSAVMSGPARLTVWLQGASDFPTPIDHHVRLYVNGSFVGEAKWNGKIAHRVEASVDTGLLDDDNVLEIENVGDTAAAYSMVMLNRFAVDYPRAAVADVQRWEGSALADGTLRVRELGEHVSLVRLTGDGPEWVDGVSASVGGSVQFSTRIDHRYFAAGARALEQPTVRWPTKETLRSHRHQADYLVIGPRDFVEAARPLWQHRESQGLRVRAVSFEQIVSEFGFGERSPEAIRDFLEDAYHRWSPPSFRYVLLLGDTTYDPKNFLGVDVVDHLPSPTVRTSYLWTVSDADYATLNGDDGFPDVAVGRLPAANVDELRAMVDKILEQERNPAGAFAPIVLIADNPDEAGNFEADANELAHGVLAARNVQKIYLSRLGASATRARIQQAFDDGPSVVSYLGHGGIHLWASENVFNNRDVGNLQSQSRRPLLFTMNCLNGYFHFPFFNSLSEELLKARDKGVVAAFSPSGLSLHGPAHQYHRAMLREVTGGNHRRLGDAVLAAQRVYADTGVFPELLNIYHLFGDPAMPLP